MVFNQSSSSLTTPGHKIIICEAPDYGFNPCSASPCLNGGTCTPSLGHTPAYMCQCDLWFEGTECDIALQLLIINPQRTGIWVANMSDFVFSSFVDFGNSAQIVTMIFDDTTDTLYWTDLVKGTMSKAYEPMELDVRMHKMGWANWTVLSADIVVSGLYECLTLDIKKQQLHWMTYPDGHSQRAVRQEGAVSNPVELSRVPISESYVIDQRRRYLYTLHRTNGIHRINLDDGHTTELTGSLEGRLFKGMTIDEEGERLFWTQAFLTQIAWFDLKKIQGPFTLINFESTDMRLGLGSILFVPSGWLVWLNMSEDQVCIARAEVDSETRFCVSTSVDGLPHRLRGHQNKALALRRI
eukprot:XP_011677803.1 PREDICTED: uncharacterized protein LOC105444794 [Strongylocentrotus purpuratus]